MTHGGAKQMCYRIAAMLLNLNNLHPAVTMRCLVVLQAPTTPITLVGIVTTQQYVSEASTY